MKPCIEQIRRNKIAQAERSAKICYARSFRGTFNSKRYKSDMRFHLILLSIFGIISFVLLILTYGDII